MWVGTERAQTEGGFVTQVTDKKNRWAWGGSGEKKTALKKRGKYNKQPKGKKRKRGGGGGGGGVWGGGGVLCSRILC